MAYKLSYHPEALTTLEEIFEWSREHHPETTEKFGEDLLANLDRLTLFRYVGQMLKKRLHIRRLSHPPLYIYYRIDENKRLIEILRFRHAARRTPRF
jgi:plasmid stabilization system protein ParE